MLFSVVVTSRQYIGDPIDCMVDEIPHEVMDTYCWIYSTFTIPDRLTGRIGKDIIHPGVAPYAKGEDAVKYHKYYQWVCFVLFFQAILFYIPHYLWKIFESGRISKLVQELKGPIIPDDAKSDRINLIVSYFVSNLHAHKFYSYRFFFCEILNLVNVIGQIYFMDYFLDGEFSTYGMDVFKFTGMDPDERDDPMARVFPKVAKCTFHKYGPSGTVQYFDGLCVLPINIVNEKIYVFLWFWLVALSVVTGLAIIYRVAILALPGLREIRLRSVSRFAASKEIKTIIRKFEVGDWFLLYQIGINTDPLIFKEIISKLANDLES